MELACARASSSSPRLAGNLAASFFVANSGAPRARGRAVDSPPVDYWARRRPHCPDLRGLRGFPRHWARQRERGGGGGNGLQQGEAHSCRRVSEQCWLTPAAWRRRVAGVDCGPARAVDAGDEAGHLVKHRTRRGGGSGEHLRLVGTHAPVGIVHVEGRGLSHEAPRSSPARTGGLWGNACPPRRHARDGGSSPHA